MNVNPFDIRLGNILHYDGEEIEVLDFSEYGINISDKGFGWPAVYGFDFNDPKLTGIPITEERLIKLGFSRDNEHNLLLLHNIFITLMDEEWILATPYFAIDARKVKIKFMHQLHNFYYTLHNKEIIPRQ